MKEKLLISACLMGENCKYNGGNNYLPTVDALKEHYDLIPVCPEQDGGLPTPRVPAERVGDRVITRDGEDVTSQYVRGAELALQTAQQHSCTKALLKERSPSCGCGLIYDGTFTHTTVPGNGVTAQLLKEHGLSVCGESCIDKLTP